MTIESLDEIIYDENNSDEHKQYYYFTFGCEQAFPNGYVKIYGTFLGSRRLMYYYFGSKWCAQYDLLDNIDPRDRHEVIIGDKWWLKK